MEEIPSYPPAGEGDHCFVHIEKRDLTTSFAIRQIARALGTDARDAGKAGMKDRYGVTRQWVSFHEVTPEAVMALEVEGVRFLEATRHTHKLRTGHLTGNRFVLRVRGANPADAERAAEVMTTLATSGIANYFGPQRFGRDNLAKAEAWLIAGGRKPKNRGERRMLVSSLQSRAFNEALRARVEGKGLGHIRDGELVRKEDTGGLFCVDDVEEAQARSDAFAISPTAPMFGVKMRWPERDAGAEERALAESVGITDEVMRGYKKFGEGTRRVVRVRPTEVSCEPVEGGFVVRFTLRKGSYATVVMRELFKEEVR